MGTLAEVLSNPLGVVEWFVYLLAAVSVSYTHLTLPTN